MRTKRFVAALMSMVMILTLLPFTGTATEKSTGISSITETADGMVLTKSAELQADGTYKITLEAFASGQTTTSITTDGIPMDIALVINGIYDILYRNRKPLDVLAELMTRKAKIEHI